MEEATRQKLVEIAREKAQMPFHGFIEGEESIILEVKVDVIIVAEGNTSNDNISKVVNRPIDEHIRAYIRIPNGYKY